MQKILRQNIDNVDYSMAGCSLYGTCTTSAPDFIKAVVLTDGDILSDGMSLAVAFTYANTAGNAPKTITIYSSDQVHYYSDSGLTQPFTLAPSGCYTITYTGTGNAYTYKSFPVLSAGGVTAPICSMNGSYIGNTAWNAGDIGVFIYTAGRFLLVSVNLENGTGVLPVAHGGTNATTAGGACTNLIGALTVATGDVTDNTDIITSNAGGYAEQSDKTIYKRKGIKFWNYIKAKLGNVIKAVYANGYWGMADPNGADNVWIRTTNQGIIPYVGGNKGSGHQMVGTSSWYFSHGYFDNLHSVNVEADTVTANGYQLKRYYAIDTSGLSASNFYPVTFNSSDLELDCEIHSPNLSGSAAYNQNHIHFLLTWQGWSDTPKRLVVLSYGVFAANEITIGCIGTGNQNGANCVWVRGGRLYRFYCNRTPTLRTADWSYGDEKFTVGTSQSGGTNANVTVAFQPSNYTGFGSYFKDTIYGTIDSARYTYGTALCTTAGATSAKVASMLGFVLQSGATFPITFTNANSVQGAITLAVNGTTAKPIYINGSASSNTNYTLPAGTYICRYDGSYYYIDTGYAVTQARNASTLGGQAIDSISRYESTAWCHQYIIRGSHSILFFNHSQLMFPGSTTVVDTFPVSFSTYTKYVIRESYNANVSYSVSTTGVTITNSGTTQSVVVIHLIIEGTIA